MEQSTRTWAENEMAAHAAVGNTVTPWVDLLEGRTEIARFLAQWDTEALFNLENYGVAYADIMAAWEYTQEREARYAREEMHGDVEPEEVVADNGETVLLSQHNFKTREDASEFLENLPGNVLEGEAMLDTLFQGAGFRLAGADIDGYNGLSDEEVQSIVIIISN